MQVALYYGYRAVSLLCICSSIFASVCCLTYFIYLFIYLFLSFVFAKIFCRRGGGGGGHNES